MRFQIFLAICLTGFWSGAQGDLAFKDINALLDQAPLLLTATQKLISDHKPEAKSNILTNAEQQAHSVEQTASEIKALLPKVTKRIHQLDIYARDLLTFEHQLQNELSFQLDVYKYHTDKSQNELFQYGKHLLQLAEEQASKAESSGGVEFTKSRDGVKTSVDEFAAAISSNQVNVSDWQLYIRTKRLKVVLDSLIGVEFAPQPIVDVLLARSQEVSAEASKFITENRDKTRDHLIAYLEGSIGTLERYKMNVTDRKAHQNQEFNIFLELLLISTNQVDNEMRLLADIISNHDRIKSGAAGNALAEYGELLIREAYAELDKASSHTLDEEMTSRIETSLKYVEKLSTDVRSAPSGAANLSFLESNLKSWIKLLKEELELAQVSK